MRVDRSAPNDSSPPLGDGIPGCAHLVIGGLMPSLKRLLQAVLVGLDHLLDHLEPCFRVTPTSLAASILNLFMASRALGTTSLLLLLPLLDIIFVSPFLFVLVLDIALDGTSASILSPANASMRYPDFLFSSFFHALGMRFPIV